MNKQFTPKYDTDYIQKWFFDQETNKIRLPGEIILFGGVSLPEGWLLCDGSTISRNKYKNLFKAIGTYYGAGDETSTFNLPEIATEGNVALEYWIIKY